MHFDDLGTEFRFDQLTGTSVDRCAWVGYRALPFAAHDPTRMESWVVLPSETFAPEGARLVGLELGVPGFLTGLWYAPSGRLFASDFHGRIYVREIDERALPSWRVEDWGELVELHGVWGLDDHHVYVWGRDAYGPRMWQTFEGRFVGMQAPPGPTTFVRGCSPECLYAAGAGGALAHWNGHGWRPVPIQSVRPATGLCVVSEDEIWLTTDMGKLFEGTSHGWALRAELDGPLCDVMRWRGQLLLAAKDRGLLQLDEPTNGISPVDLMLPAIGLAGDTDTLLALTEDYLAVSKDGRKFEVLCREVALEHRENEAPLWQASVHDRG